MRTDVGRFFENRANNTLKTLKLLHDLGLGAGTRASAWIDGRELVFGVGEEKTGVVYMRANPGETTVMLSFPRGAEIHDPLQRAKGVPPGTRRTLTLREPTDVDVYVRRMIAIAYDLENSAIEAAERAAQARARAARGRARGRMPPPRGRGMRPRRR